MRAIEPNIGHMPVLCYAITIKVRLAHLENGLVITVESGLQIEVESFGLIHLDALSIAIASREVV